MALSSSDAFIVLNELLQDYDTELLKATERLTEIKIITKERSEVRDALEKLLASKKIPYGELTRNVGSFGGTEIETVDEKIRLIYKQKETPDLVVEQKQLDLRSPHNVFMLQLLLVYADILQVMM